MHTHIHDAFLTAQDWAKWALHQPLSTLGSWILTRDTWIHPNTAGATQLANTVVSAMCSSFGHWCGPTRVWG